MAIKAYKKIKSKWPNRFLAYSLNNLSHVYLKLTDQRDAEESMLDDFKVREKLQERYPNEFTETVNALAKYLLALYLIKLDSFGYKEYDQDLLSKFNYIEPRLKYIANSNDSVRKVLVQFYGRNSWFLLFARKYNMAVEMAEKALKIDSTQPWIRLNLANALLFDNQFDRAILMYKAFKTDKQNTNNEFEKNCNKDFDEFERHGITNKYIPIIREFLNN